LQRIIRTGMAALTLLLLSACATAPAKVSTLLPPPQATLQSPPPTTSSPVSIPAKMPPAPLRPAETGAAPSPTVAAAEPVSAPVEPTAETGAASPDYVQTHASYYAKRFNGRRTYTGERYDPEKLTAATRDFPLHSWLKVINPANGKEVNVCINDLTGKRKTPLVDLSRAAAKALGFLGKGKIRVHVIPLLPTP
jgi:rare lipoprotein A